MMAKVQPFYSNQRRVIHKKLLAKTIEGISGFAYIVACVHRPVF
jgi:hypothetical protein